MTQVALRSESEFAAGVACRPCRIIGHHFCQAHDYDAKDEPACKTCLTGELCGPMRARKPAPEFDGPDLPPPAPAPIIAKPLPAKPKPDLLRGEKLAETMEQREAKPGLCAYCEKPRHRGVCAARRVALAATGTKFAGFAPPLVDRFERRATEEGEPAAGLNSLHYQTPPPDEVGIALASMQRSPAVTPDITPDPTRAEIMQEILESPVVAQILDEPANEAAVLKVLGQPVFEVVLRSEVQLRPTFIDRYAELADRLRKLGAGELLKISFATEAKADSYAKNVSRRLAPHKLRVKYERHGEVLFLEVKQPVLPTSEVLAP